MAQYNEQECLIALTMVEGLGSVGISRLIKAFSRPNKIFKAGIDKLFRIEGINQVIAGRLEKALENPSFKEELSLIRKEGVRIIGIYDEKYPALLKQIYDPPAVIYARGNIDILNETLIAVVGCRRASFYGLRQAEQFSASLALRGIGIVSGFARGIDTAAHEGALKAGGKTIAVLGSGLDNIYPGENRNLAEKILAKNGAVISEFPLRMGPRKENFPRRNRIISGLCRGVIVVEAAARSGALITADFALEQGREIFAVPGPANSLNSQGTNRLIKEGAKLIETAGDVLEELNLMADIREEKNKGLPVALEISEPASNLLRFLTLEPLHIDMLIKASKLTSAQVYNGLLELQLKGLVEEIAGKRFIRKEAV